VEAEVRPLCDVLVDVIGWARWQCGLWLALQLSSVDSDS
jgi:hypothetical protein